MGQGTRIVVESRAFWIGLAAAALVWPLEAQAWVGGSLGGGYAQATLSGPLVAPTWINQQSAGDPELAASRHLGGAFSEAEFHGGISQFWILNAGLYARRYQLHGSWDHMHYTWNSLEYGPRVQGGIQGRWVGVTLEGSYANASGFSLTKQGASTSQLDGTPAFTRTENFFGSYNSGTIGLNISLRPTTVLALSLAVESAVWDLLTDNHYEVKLGEATAYSAGFAGATPTPRADVIATRIQVSLDF